MITDISAIPRDTVIDSDVCIIGAGAAGIAIARELTRTGLQVVVLESGGYRREREVQDLYSGESVGETYYKELEACRSRYFGGSTNCWGAIFTPLNEIDFEKREWVPWSGWPVSYGEVHPWLQHAHCGYGAGPFLYGEEAWDAARIPPVDIDRALFEPFVWHFDSRSAALSFAKRYRAELRGASNIHVFLHANVTELITNEPGRVVERARIRSLDGEERFVRSRVFILACGGIENPRLLLASNRTQRNGLGNDRDLVGRFFHEHLQMPIGYLVSDRPRAARYSYLSRLDGTFCLPGFVLTPSAQRKNRSLNGSVSIDPVYDHEGAWMAFQNIRANFKERKISRETLRHVWRICCESNKFAPEAWRRVVSGDRPRGESGRFLIYGRAEQSPNPESRVKLSREVDALGMRRASLEWRTCELDRVAIKLLWRYVKREFTRLDPGRVIENPWPDGNGWPEGLVEGPHHMGTTRMSDDPSNGVVDRDCRVHGVDGLYIAGSSIFPTGGHANPTMSIIAFALRLASHVSQQLCREVSSSSVREMELQPTTGAVHATAAARIAAVTKPIDPDTQPMLPAGTN
jgi:choline dehydrogenase-like flavoprotein